MKTKTINLSLKRPWGLCFLMMFLLSFSVNSQAQNPYLPLWEHVPDGEPRVFEDPDNPGKYRAPYVVSTC